MKNETMSSTMMIYVMFEHVGRRSFHIHVYIGALWPNETWNMERLMWVNLSDAPTRAVIIIIIIISFPTNRFSSYSNIYYIMKVYARTSNRTNERVNEVKTGIYEMAVRWLANFKHLQTTGDPNAACTNERESANNIDDDNNNYLRFWSCLNSSRQQEKK